LVEKAFLAADYLLTTWVGRSRWQQKESKPGRKKRQMRLPKQNFSFSGKFLYFNEISPLSTALISFSG
jgi:hypothetical protein